MAKIKDTDYLFISTRIRSLERNLLTRERMERMLEASTYEDAAKVLLECGYGELSGTSAVSLEENLANERQKLFDDLYAFAPNPGMVDVFKAKYDYHNAKVLLKSEAKGLEPERLFIDAGRIPAKKLEEALRQSDLRNLPSVMRSAVQEARETLSVTGDPQLSDFILDSAYYREVLSLAEASGSKFLLQYMRTTIDAANLRSAVRTLRMQKSGDFLRRVLFPGGHTDISRIITTATSGGSLEELFATSPLRDAAAAGAAAVAGGSLTEFEKLCDNAVMAYAAKAKYVAFGDEPLVGYLAAKDAEITAVRIIMASRLAGLTPDAIRERLREAYV